MHKASVAFLILILIWIAFDQEAYGAPEKGVHVPGKTEGSSHGDALADFSWIILLCLFSLIAKFKRDLKSKLGLLALAFLLLALAAVHSHPLWSFSKLSLRPNHKTILAHVWNVPAAVVKTGLEVDDIVHAIYFDPGGKLWMAANLSGLYFYSVPTNELTTLLRPDQVYGLFQDPHGMWILTSHGAFLYREESIVKMIHFPEGVIPLCGAYLNEDLFFGTTRGLYRARFSDSIALHEALDLRVNQIVRQTKQLLLATEKGVWWINQDGDVGAYCSTPLQSNINCLVVSDGHLFAATDSHGILILEKIGSKRIKFAKKAMNLFSPGAAASIGDIPFFGTMEGSIVYFERGRWKRILTGDSAITAMAADSNSVYAWISGRLLRIQFDRATL